MGGQGPVAVTLATRTADKDDVNGTGETAPSVLPPIQVSGLHATDLSDCRVSLSWNPPSLGPDEYKVQYRRARSYAWMTSGGIHDTKTTIDGLDGNTGYEFQVFGVSGGIFGTPSGLVAARTKPREPVWSDLVMSSGPDGAEVDLARLQMLVFTSIAAAFTALTLINTGQIPDIPVGELALVGVSNGVYLASKASNS